MPDQQPEHPSQPAFRRFMGILIALSVLAVIGLIIISQTNGA